MDIDSYLIVELTYLTDDGQRNNDLIPASDFFDYEEYDPPEWDCDLPWRYMSLNDFIEVPESKLLESGVTVSDQQRKRTKRVHTQYLQDGKVTFSWNDVSTKPEELEVIVDIGKIGSSIAEIARIDINKGQCCLTKHSRIDGHSIRSLMPDG